MTSKVFVSTILLVVVLGLISNAFARVVEIEKERFVSGGGGFHHGPEFGFHHGSEFAFRHGGGFGRGFESGALAASREFELGALAASREFGAFGAVGAPAVFPGAAIVAQGAGVIIA